MPTNTASTQIAAVRAKLLLLMTLDPKEIGRRIKSAREERGWSQMQLAVEAHVSISSITRWEAGKLPPIRELARLAAVLGVEPGYLVEGAVNVAELPMSELEALTAEVRRLRQGVEENGQKLDELLQARSQPH